MVGLSPPTRWSNTRGLGWFPVRGKGIGLSAFPSATPPNRQAPIPTYKGSRANEYSCTLEIPELLVNFNIAYNALEVQRKPKYRRFQATEITKQRHPLLRDNPVKMLTQDVAIAHLTNEQTEQVLRQNAINVGQ